MIDQDNKIIYVDYSTLSTFKACKRKGQLGYAIGYRSEKSASALTLGHGIHAAYEAYYDALSGGYHTEVVREDGSKVKVWQKFQEGVAIDPVQQAMAAFLKDMQVTGGELPIERTTDEHRSIERAMGIIQAYCWRWRNEPYRNYLDKEGAPLTEVAFKYPLARWEGFDIWYCGYIDKIMQNISSDRPVLFESKTTGQSPKIYIQQRKPNDQVTGYFPAVHRIIEQKVYECIWDVTFVSKRAPNMQAALKEGQRFMAYGVDIEEDFQRQPTQRSQTDITEFLEETEEWAVEYAKYLTSQKQWWPKTAPGACHAYGGCAYRDACSINGDARTAYLNSKFIIKKWEPHKAVAGSAWWQD